ncbi:MAG: TatD family deoxyribonuclease, partial [Thermotoga sp.]
YPKNDVLRDAVRKIGARYLLPETDCPYLPPVPNRGKRNEPIYVEYVILKMSEILLIEPEKLSEILLENTSDLFLEVKE